MGIRNELREIFNKINNYTVIISLKERCKADMGYYTTKFKGEEITIFGNTIGFNVPVSTATAESILELVEENDIETIKII